MRPFDGANANLNSRRSPPVRFLPLATQRAPAEVRLKTFAAHKK